MTRFHDRNYKNVHDITAESDCALFMEPLVQKLN